MENSSFQLERKNNLDVNPRQFDLGDVLKVQQVMRGLNEGSDRRGVSGIFGESAFYRKFTEDSEVNSLESKASKDSFDKSVSTLLALWGEQKKILGEGLETLQEAKDMFTLNSRLNEYSPIHFQDGAEYASGRFVHILTGRTMGKSRESATKRYYLNPAADKVGLVVDQLTGAALQASVPLYFKFVDVATGMPDKRTMERTDRIDIYASDRQSEFVDSLISNIISLEPKAFAGRTVAGFGEILGEGVSRADEVTEEQNERFKGNSTGVSFNYLRCKLVHEATLSVVKDLISNSATSSILMGGKSIRQIFADSVSEGMTAHDLRLSEDDPELNEEIKMGIPIDSSDEARGLGVDAREAVSDGVVRTARKILPHIDPESLMYGYDHYIHKIAPRYGIDPDNLAKNIPIVDN